MKHLMMRCVSLLLVLAPVAAFVAVPTTNILPSLASSNTKNTCHFMSTTSDSRTDEGSSLTSKGLLKRDRYIATNRFAVRQGKAAKFEQRWANRKSRLAELDGFRYFHLMRRVILNDDGGSSYDEGNDEVSAQGNMVSFTVWEKKSDFSAWRTGEAFKEAHGGTSIGAFVSTMVNSALVLRGAPRPAFYDGILVQAIVPESIPETVDGWRNIKADGIETLPTECFVACNQFHVPTENAAAFEQRWANRESQLAECDGFVSFSMLRRDGQAKGHGTVEMDASEPTYVSTTIWKDRSSFESWKNGNAFRQAHGGGSGNPASGKPPKAEGETQKEEDTKPPSPPAPLWSRPPKPVFYEGVLVISSQQGV